jgi:hypothetical protein
MTQVAALPRRTERQQMQQPIQCASERQGSQTRRELRLQTTAALKLEELMSTSGLRQQALLLV